MQTDYVLDPVGLAQVLVETQSGQSDFYLPGLAQYNSSNGWSYYAQDRLGSTRQLIDPTGALMQAQTFDPFGNVLEQTGTTQSIFNYTGEQTDPTGLVFLRARYYDPGIGRFLTADSIVPDPLSSQGWNRYAYVENNPVRFADPSGHCNIGGGNLAVMEQMPCIGGGGPSLGKPVGGGEVVTTATLFTLATFLRFLWDSIAILQEEPLPHTPEIKPCSLDSGFLPDLTGDVPPFELLSFPAPRVPSLEDILDADPIEPGIELPYVWNVKLHGDAQGKHIPGHKNYIPGRSIITHPDPQGLLDQHTGRGNPLRGTYGQSGYKEWVDFGEEIGLYVDEDTGQSTPTTKGVIHYSERGAHIVPARP